MSNALRLGTLTIEGIRSFVERQTIVFPEKGAILITGQWVGSDTSSGIGKSTIPIAIAWILGFSNKPATRLKSWYSKKIFGSLTLIDRDITYTVTRDPKLKVHDGIKEYDGTAAEERLAAILKTSPELAKLLTYREQRTKGTFLTSTDAENKENFIKVLNLGEVEVAVDRLSDRLTPLVIKKTQLEAEMKSVTDMLATCVVSDQDLEEARRMCVVPQSRVDELTNSGDQKAELAAKLSKLQGYARQISQAKRDQSRAETENFSLKNNALALKSEIDQMKLAKCPTCKQDWMKFQEALELRQTSLKDSMRRYEENLVAIKNFQPMIDAEPKIEAQVAEIYGRLASIDAPLADATRALEMAKHNLKTLLGKVEIRKNMEGTHLRAARALEQTNHLIGITKHASAVLGRDGFQGAIFDEVLQEIQTKTNNMITSIPNISPYTLKISSTSMTQKGKVNREINAKVFREGRETQIDDASGGQACGLELFTDLAYASSVRKRCASPLGWICLDEAMDGLDVAPKRAALEVIKSMVGGQIIVIDHATEIKEGFESVIEVSYDGRESRIISS